jgi:hypothetical protein
MIHRCCRVGFGNRRIVHLWRSALLSRFFSYPGPRRLIVAALFVFCCAPLAQAETVHVAASAEAGLPYVQARQQALERAFVEAVTLEATRMLPAALPQERAQTLRGHLAPLAGDLAMSYQETAGTKQSQSASQTSATGTPPVFGVELDVEVNRPALRGLLLRLGLLSTGARNYSLRLGPGVVEKDLAGCEEVSRLMGLSQTTPAPLEVTLERLPQGYYKGVLRQPGNAAAAVVVADDKDLVGLWQKIWGQLFAGKDFRPGGASRWVDVSGFSGVEAVHGFDQILSTWDEAIQDVALVSVELRPQGISARWSARVVQQNKLASRLAEALPQRGLTLARAAALLGDAAKP